jgi:hypothetical protein
LAEQHRATELAHHEDCDYRLNRGSHDEPERRDDNVDDTLAGIVRATHT